jgi:hypothetical protein
MMGKDELDAILRWWLALIFVTFIFDGNPDIYDLAMQFLKDYLGE